MDKQLTPEDKLEGELMKRINTLIKERTDAVRHAEKLMRLLKGQILDVYSGYKEEYQEQNWQSYCKEHNLNP